MQAPTLIIDKRLVSAGDMSDDIVSPVSELSEVGGYSLHCVWTGTPVGNLLIEGSNIEGSFVTVLTQAVGGAAGEWLVNIERQHYKFIRLTYDRTSSTGTLIAHLTAKNI